MIVAADWVTISALATAGGTLVLALATFASVRSANRAARLAERSLLAGIRPVLAESRPQDPPQKVGFQDERWFQVPGNGAIAEATEEAIYLAIAIRNLGAGIAVLQGWCFSPELLLGSMGHAPLDEFHRLTRDIYIAGGETGFWQGTFRDPTSAEFAEARDVLLARQRFTVEILYGDNEGGQRTISRFAVVPRDEDGWIAAVGRHWNIDRPDPR